MSPMPRHVIVDLLPLYLADELSPETRQVVEEYLQTDEALAASVRAASAEALSFEGGGTTAPPDIELRSVARTRALLAWQRWLFGLALGFSAVGLSLEATLRGGRVANLHLMLRDFPIPFGTCLLAAAGCWLGYYALRRRLNGRG